MIKLDAHAKINLALDICGLRDDGYHNVHMIMQSIELCDTIELEKTNGGIELCGSGVSVPYDETNLAHRAAALFFSESEISGGVRINIFKRIPVCAGLGGGSADAAGVLCGLNDLYGKPLDTQRLMKIGAKLGADIPFCILGGTAVAEGIGDILTPVAKFGEYSTVIVKPPVGVSTAWAYGALAENADDNHPDISAAVSAIERGSFDDFCPNCQNVFEKSVFERYPQIGDIKQKLLSLGADCAAMSGSGAAVFGIFKDESSAQDACKYFEKIYKEVFLTKTI